MDSNYYHLFILINVSLLTVNIVLLLISVRHYLIEKTKPGEFIESDQSLAIESDGALVNSDVPDAYLKAESKRSDVLISKITEDRLLQEFEKAQAKLFFLKRSVSLNDVADLLGTNQRYASYIINKYFGSDFNSYVQRARIKYLIDCVEHDPNLLKMKFSVLADKAGFSSISKFSSVFKSVIGISPSAYFQRLRMR
ncbi:MULTISPECIES: helix-turn-helix domain-containing protein [Sphingobacterium]|uniref:HTH araC/xylS-type domain-containing protein n=1 Tax=Sphingobacterium ginsenosidimutans TaxID=687845 RepID=A0ABP7ZW57_9SPHI|nr:AraC family transcriptional regulator [Sphingobacterium sp. E70]ULT23644.1 AraC family transcriptional regulator [Sphingobacterium sp. E70]